MIAKRTMSELRLSVVIPTYNRRPRLARVLEAFERQETPCSEFEVIVVNDGSTDDTAAWLAARATPYRMRSLTLTNGGPARARNAGVEAAEAPIVLFIDDDVEPMNMLVSEHLKSHAAEADVVVIGPLGSLDHYAQPWVAWEQAKIEGQYAAMARGDWKPTFRQFWTGNASVARKHLLAAGGFDPTYLRAEDVELGVRLSKQGIGFRFNPAALGLHHAERSLASWEVAHVSYGEAEVHIFGKLGEAALLDMLGYKWLQLDPTMRRLIRSCIGHPLRHSAARALLRGHLRFTRHLPVPVFSEKACSVLANLLYWQASAERLGPERAAIVFGEAPAPT